MFIRIEICASKYCKNTATKSTMSINTAANELKAMSNKKHATGMLKIPYATNLGVAGASCHTSGVHLRFNSARPLHLSRAHQVQTSVVHLREPQVCSSVHCTASVRLRCAPKVRNSRVRCRHQSLHLRCDPQVQAPAFTHPLCGVVLGTQI